MTAQSFQSPPGHVVCTTWGLVTKETAHWLLEMRSQSERQGLNNIVWRMEPGTLIDKLRNDTARAMMADANAQWLLFVDADMQGPPEALVQLLYAAYGSHPHFDVLGGYANLRGEMAIPTIDTGTGTWESWYPGQGVVEVMRTGAAFLLIKRHVFDRIRQPWFATRVPLRPLDAIQEVDSFCRTIFDGRNPFQYLTGEPWEQMVQCAATHMSVQGPWVPAEVGEDSSFCDRVTAAGLRIGVCTDIVVNHIDHVARGPGDHRKWMVERERQDRLLSGFCS